MYPLQEYEVRLTSRGKKGVGRSTWQSTTEYGILPSAQGLVLLRIRAMTRQPDWKVAASPGALRTKDGKLDPWTSAIASTIDYQVKTGRTLSTFPFGKSSA